jgi:hypothetical protein
MDTPGFPVRERIATFLGSAKPPDEALARSLPDKNYIGESLEEMGGGKKTKISMNLLPVALNP